MAYTPELSLRSSCTLRRISWALGVPMTQGIEFVFDYLPHDSKPGEGLPGLPGPNQMLGMLFQQEP